MASTVLDTPSARPRPTRPGRPASRRPAARTQVLVGLAAALRAVAFALLPLAVVVLVGWAGAGGGESTAQDAVRVTAFAWLLGHGVDLTLDGGVLGLSPIGLGLLPLATLTVAATQAVRACGARTPVQAVPALAGLVVTYAAVAAGIAAVSGSPSVAPSVPGALLGGSLLALVGGSIGAVRALRRRPRAVPAMPARPGLVLAGAVSGLCALLGAAALLVAGSLVLHADEAVASMQSLAPGPLGGALLLGLQVLLLPNAVVLAASYAVGPGFYLGEGTAVAPSGVVLGPLPDLPLLVALPGPGRPPALSMLVLAAPALAGAVAGAVVARRAAAGTSADRAAAYAALSGLAAALGLGVLGLLSGGPAGGDALARIGPSVLPVTLAAAGELSLMAAAVAWLLVHRASAAATAPTGRTDEPQPGPRSEPDEAAVAP